MTAHHNRPGDGSLGVKQVVAHVDLQRRVVEEIRQREDVGDQSSPKRVVVISASSPESLNLVVSLSVQSNDGRWVRSDGPDFAIGGPRRGVGAIWHRYHGPSTLPEDPRDQSAFLERHHVGIADIEDGINQMLGRDPALHRPPSSSWRRLIEALEEHGIIVTEQALINATLAVDLHPEVQAELENHQ